jgi:hypothetical protein
MHHHTPRRGHPEVDIMRITTLIGAGILTGIAGSALACDLPKLAVIPAKDQVAGKEAEVRASASAYFTAMQAYTACIQAELAGAGGESAPAIVKKVLVARNNSAVAEAEFMMKLFTENVGAVDAVPVGEARTER